MTDGNRTFTVETDRLEAAGFTKGQTVSEDQLVGANVDALVAAGHLVETSAGQTAPQEASE